MDRGAWARRAWGVAGLLAALAGCGGADPAGTDAGHEIVEVAPADPGTGADLAPDAATDPGADPAADAAADLPQEVRTDPLNEHGLIVPLDAIPCLDWDTGEVLQTGCNHHGSSVWVEADGTVRVAWYHGKGEKSKDSRVLWAAKPPGRDWQPWSVLYDDPGRAEGNPVLWRSEKTGELVLFFVTLYGDTWDDGKIRAIRSPDGGATWSAPVTIRETLGWMTRNKPLRLTTGELLLPTYDEALYVPSFLISADDFVADWLEVPFAGADLVAHPHQIQPTVIERDDGSPFALLRNTNPVVPQYAWEMASSDAGRSWGAASASVIPNSSASLEMVRARRGVVALTFNNSVAGRCPLAVALSDDEGRTWSAVANVLDACVAQGGSYGYPSIAEDPTDGSFWVSYTHDRRTIGWVHVTEAWIRAHPAPLAHEPRAWGPLGAVVAPDRTTLTVTFQGEPDADAASQPGTYALTSDHGGLAVTKVSYDAAARRTTLTTSPQKLGVTYTATVTPPTGDALSGSAVAADSTTFWISDPDDETWSQTSVHATRVAVGERVVVYQAAGEWVEDPASLADEFDQVITLAMAKVFPQPPDRDGNGRIVILGISGDYGGYFNPLNQYPDATTLARYGLHSNEMELLHLNPSFGDWYYGTTMAHEYQHLLYHANHGLDDGYFEYHDEGLAECAVHVVYGQNEMALQMLQWDASGLIAGGLSLVHWTYAQYENYALAYLFWTYVMTQLDDGVVGYRRIFDVPSGSPAAITGFLQAALGADLALTHAISLAALWTQAPSGPFGYHGQLQLPPGAYPTVPAGTTSVALEPFAGAFFPLAQSPVGYPGTQGPHILYLGVGTAGVDMEAPFDVAGGALLAYNRANEWSDFTPEPSGPGLPARPSTPGWALPHATGLAWPGLRPDWRDPPPLLPDQAEAWTRWRASIVD